jgi:hypothetical protein
MPAPEGRAHCKHGHDPEHQTRNARGHHTCGLCARAAKAKFELVHSDKNITHSESIKANSARLAEQRRCSPTCLHGHPWVNNTVFYSDTRRCLECSRIRDKKKGKGRVASQEMVSRVLEGLSHGLTLHQMTSSDIKKGVYRPHDGIKKIASLSRLNSFFEAHPKLGKRIRETSKKNAIRNLRDSNQSTRAMAAPALLRNNGVDSFEAVQRATVGIWEDDRGDVQALMWIAIVENKLSLRDCTPAKANEYLKIHRRRPNVFGSYSLDTPIGEDIGMTWLDTKTDEDRLWA